MRLLFHCQEKLSILLAYICQTEQALHNFGIFHLSNRKNGYLMTLICIFLRSSSANVSFSLDSWFFRCYNRDGLDPQRSRYDRR